MVAATHDHLTLSECRRCGSRSDVSWVTFLDSNGTEHTEQWCYACKREKLIRARRSGRPRRRRAARSSVGSYITYAGYAVLAFGAALAVLSFLGVV